MESNENFPQVVYRYQGVVYFKDGTQYCVYDWRNQIYNTPGGLWRRSEEYAFDDLVIPFNRLIDINEISHVDVLYEDYEDVLIDGKTEVLSHRHNCIFYP